jgi:hypothetical protein
MEVRLTYRCLFFVAGILQVFVAILWFLTHRVNNFHNAGLIEWLVIILLLLAMNLFFAYYRSRKMLFFINQQGIKYEKGTKLITIKWEEVSQIKIHKFLSIQYIVLILKDDSKHYLCIFCITKQDKKYIEEMMKNFNDD